jgi:hypothetical protein
MQRLTTFLKRLALVLGILLALALIANAILVWQTGKRLEERLTSLRAEGVPLSLPELGAVPPAAGADAGAVLKRLAPEIKALSKEMAPWMDEEKHPRPWKDEVVKALEQALANHPTVLPGLHEAAGCPSYRSPLNYQASDTSTFLPELLPDVQIQRESTNILLLQARLQLHRHDRDGALRTCLTSLRLSRHAEGEPMLISFLVVIATRAVGIGAANEILRAGPVAADLHRELDEELAKHDSPAAFRRCLRSELAYGLQALDEQNLGGWFLRAYNNDEKCYYIDLNSEWVAQADSSYAQFMESVRSTQAAAGGILHARSRLLIPAVHKVREADFRARCLVRCLRVLNALTAGGATEPPAKLADLNLPEEAVTDPYTDKPLVVKRKDGQWLIYGLGTNLKDDGGHVKNLEDVGLGKP